MNSRPSPTDELRCGGCQTPFANLIPEPPRRPTECPQTLPNVLAALPDSESIHQSIASARQGIDVLDNRITQLEELTERCRASRQRHEEFIEHSNGLLFSANRLPSEIWVQIFKLASTDSLDDSKTFESASPHNAPLSISHVSREWRLLSLRTPSLWSNISLALSSEDLLRSTLSLLSAYLTRGLSHRLDIVFASDCYNIAPEDVAAQAFGMLIAHSSRWRSVTLDLASSVYSLDLFPVAFTPNLESVSIATYNCVECNDDWSPSFLENAPKLKEVRLANFTFGRQQDFQKMLPWETVTSVEIDDFDEIGGIDTRDEIIHVLDSCPVLQKLEYSRSRHIEPSGSAAVLHNALTHLTVYAPATEFSLVAAPNLNSLTLNNVLTSQETAVQDFISRSRRLESLAIHGSFDTLSSLRSSSLRELRLHICPSHDSGSSEALMSLSTADSSLLPRLTKINIDLEFYVTRNPVDSLRIIPAISALAYKSSAQLSASIEVKVSVSQQLVPIEVLEALQNLKEMDLDGLEIELFSTIGAYP